MHESCPCKTINIKHSMDCNILNNYRLVLRHFYLVIEVAFHLNTYLINNSLNESLQSAYKSGHSTETAYDVN